MLTACDTKNGEEIPPLADDAVILAFGDSLTYGVGTSKQNSYPAVLAKLSHHKVINKGVSGEISAAGLKRLPKLLDNYKPQLLILIHGGNDILKKLPISQLADNLTQMIHEAKKRNISVVMLGVPRFNLIMMASHQVYAEVAKAENIPIDLKILPAIISDKTLKSDHVHPNAKGYQQMATAVYNLLHNTGALSK